MAVALLSWHMFLTAIDQWLSDQGKIKCNVVLGC